jgi:hypothetical protein
LLASGGQRHNWTWQPQPNDRLECPHFVRRSSARLTLTVAANYFLLAESISLQVPLRREPFRIEQVKRAEH